MAAKYNARIWEVIKEKVIEVIREEIAKALAPNTQSAE